MKSFLLFSVGLDMENNKRLCLTWPPFAFLESGRGVVCKTVNFSCLWFFPNWVVVSVPQARNIAVCIEFKDSDEEEAVSLKVKIDVLP